MAPGTSVAPAAPRASMPAAAPQPFPRATGSRRMFDAELGELVDCPVYARSELAPGSAIAGPAIVAEDETSTFVPAGFGAALDSVGYIVMERTGGGVVTEPPDEAGHEKGVVMDSNTRAAS